MFSQVNKVSDDWKTFFSLTYFLCVIITGVPMTDRVYLCICLKRILQFKT